MTYRPGRPASRRTRIETRGRRESGERTSAGDQHPGEQGSKPGELSVLRSLLSRQTSIQENKDRNIGSPQATRLDAPAGDQHPGEQGSKLGSCRSSPGCICSGRPASRRTRIETPAAPPGPARRRRPADQHPGEQGSKPGRRAVHRGRGHAGRPASRRTRIETLSTCHRGYSLCPSGRPASRRTRIET